MKSTEQEIKERIAAVAQHIIETKHTVRSTAPYFGVCKSTIFLDVTKRLKMYGFLSLYAEVKNVLEYNKSQASHRGGIMCHQTKKE